MTNEMRKFLSTFSSYIRTRSKKICDFLSYSTKYSLSSYTIVHTYHQDNVGILFQLLPKVFYSQDSLESWKPILMMDEYAKHTISFEELRYLNYSVNMKNRRHTKHNKTQPKVQTGNSSFLSGLGSLPTFPSQFHVLHSLPINYPYDESI